MAKKSPQPTTARESSFLVKSKEIFKEELKERIHHGEEYLKLEIKTMDDFEMIKKKYSVWHDYNLELLKQSFNEPYNEYRKEYDEIHFNIDLMQKSIEGLAEKRDRLFDRAETLREEEGILLRSLQEKYGEENVTPNKIMELIQ